jgi:small-conductance mechanosensitive channel
MEKWIELIKNKLGGWLTGFIKLLPNLLLAVLVFTFFFFAAKYIRNLIYRLILRISKKPAISGLFSSISYIIFLFIGLFISLELLQLEKTISSLLAGAGIIGLALGFAFQDLTANFISGVFIIFRKPFEVGHIVETNGFIGTVEEIQLRSTTIRTFQGLHIMLPNKEIFQKPITNYSLSGERRIDISLTLPAKTSTDQVEAAIHKALAGIPEISQEKEPGLFYTDYDGDKIKLEIWCWIDNKVPMGFVDARNKIIKQVYAAVTALSSQPA